MAILPYDQLVALFPDNTTGQVSPSDIRTALESSLRVYGGIEMTADKAVPLTTTPTLLVFDSSEPGYNVTTNPAAGSLTVNPGGNGRYALRLVAPKIVAPSNIEIVGQLYLNGTPLPGAINEQLENNKEISLTINIEPDLNVGDVLTLFWATGSGSTTVTFGDRTTFGIRRVG